LGVDPPKGEPPQIVHRVRERLLEIAAGGEEVTLQEEIEADGRPLRRGRGARLGAESHCQLYAVRLGTGPHGKFQIARFGHGSDREPKAVGFGHWPDRELRTGFGHRSNRQLQAAGLQAAGLGVGSHNELQAAGLGAGTHGEDRG
jgi:hypothetical protein